MDQGTVTQNRGFAVAVAMLLLTGGQLAVATFVPGLEQFEGKAFGARLAAYPVMMLALPLIWRYAAGRPLPWNAFAWIMSPFLIDVTGNTFDLYDSVSWWDDANHFVNWFLLAMGCGLLLNRASVTSRWLLSLAIAGLGALLAIGWELGEWYTFIRQGTELGTAYTDTLADEALGCLGAALAAVLIALRGSQNPADLGAKKSSADR